MCGGGGGRLRITMSIFSIDVTGTNIMIQNAKSFSCDFFVGINGVASVLRKIFSLMLPLILNLLSDLPWS